MANITGSDLADTLFGGDQNDLIFGLSGDNRLFGRSGDDTLFGGSGRDWFLFDGVIAGSVAPVIRDFDGAKVNAANGQDHVVFSSGLETGIFAYIGANAISGGGKSEARYDGPRQVQVDQDGDGAADISFRVDGVTAANLLTNTDFMWL